MPAACNVKPIISTVSNLSRPLTCRGKTPSERSGARSFARFPLDRCLAQRIRPAQRPAERSRRAAGGIPILQYQSAADRFSFYLLFFSFISPLSRFFLLAVPSLSSVLSPSCFLLSRPCISDLGSRCSDRRLPHNITLRYIATCRLTERPNSRAPCQLLWSTW